MTAADLARRNPVGTVLAVAAALAWLVTAWLALTAGPGPGATREVIRVLALAAVLTGFALWWWAGALAGRFL